MKLCDRYAALSPKRDPYIVRGRQYSALTVTSVLPPDGMSASSQLPETYQSTGARAVINLAAKLLLTLLPPGASGLKIGVPAKTVLESGTLTADPEVTRKLAQCGELVAEKIEALQWRRRTFMTLLNLIVVGNIAEFIQTDGRIKLYRIDQFVVVRDWSGKLIEVVTAEKVDYRALPPELLKYAKTDGDGDKDGQGTLYSRFVCAADDKSYTFEQALDEAVVQPEKKFTGVMPINALRWDEVAGEDYGRPHVEANYADLRTLDIHEQHMTEGGAIAARHLTFVKPNAAGGNLRKRIAEARNGAVISGNPEDVEAYQFNNSNALQTLDGQIQRKEKAIAAAFLLTLGLRRDAERVTMFELRQLAQEIESALGGTYSLLASEMQAWRCRVLVEQMGKRGELPKFPEGSVNLTVTTGLEALGRDEDVNKVHSAFDLLNSAGQQFSEQVGQRVKFDVLLSKGFTALGFASAVKTDEEVQADVQAQHAREMATNIASAAAGPAATAALQPDQQPQGQ